MPLPKPKSNEDKDTFISRCMSEINDEFPEQKQRFAICNSIYEKENKINEMKYLEYLIENKIVIKDFLEKLGEYRKPKAGMKVVKNPKFDEFLDLLESLILKVFGNEKEISRNELIKMIPPKMKEKHKYIINSLIK